MKTSWHVSSRVTGCSSAHGQAFSELNHSRGAQGRRGRGGRVRNVSLTKYRWQFGAEITGVLDRLAELGRVDLDAIDVPVLRLSGLAAESRR